MKTKKGKTLKSMHIRMPRDWVHRLKIMAAEEDTTMSAIIFSATEKELIKFEKARIKKFQPTIR